MSICLPSSSSEEIRADVLHKVNTKDSQNSDDMWAIHGRHWQLFVAPGGNLNIKPPC